MARSVLRATLGATGPRLSQVPGHTHTACWPGAVLSAADTRWAACSVVVAGIGSRSQQLLAPRVWQAYYRSRPGQRCQYGFGFRVCRPAVCPLRRYERVPGSTVASRVSAAIHCVVAAGK